MSRHHSSSASRGNTPRRFDGGGRWQLPQQPILLWAVDLLIAVLVLGLPFVMGGREAWGHRVLITLALALGAAWSLHRVQQGGRLILLSLEPLAAAALLLVWFQTTPLPASLLNRLSPEYARLLPEWSATQAPTDAAGGHAWNRVSLTPAETQHGFLVLMSYLIIGIVVAQRLSSEADCRRLLKGVAISGILMAIFAVLQLTLSNDRFFWFYRHPYTGTSEVLKGAFTNRNHFAQFLALAVGPLLWWLLDGRSRRSQELNPLRKGLGPAHGNHSRFDNLVDVRGLLLICALGGILLCVLLSLSRGGMVAAALAGVVCLGSMWRCGRLNGMTAAAVLALGVIVVLGATFADGKKVEDRVNQLASADADAIDQMNARRTIWKANLDVMRAFPLTGTGVGSHREIYPTYMPELADFSGYEFTHAESSYLNVATETGACGLGLLFLGLVAILLRFGINIFRNPSGERVALLAAIGGSAIAGIFHAAFDFIWYAPAIVVTTLMLVVTGLRICGGFHHAGGIPIPRLGWLAAAVFAVIGLASTQPHLASRVNGERSWNAYMLATRDDQDRRQQQDAPDDAESEPELTAALEALSAESDSSKNAAADELASYDNAGGSAETSDEDAELRSLQRRMTLLLQCIRADATQHRAHLILANLSLRFFELRQQHSEIPLSLSQIRDAAMTSQFPDTRSRDAWLHRAFGRPIRFVLLADQLSRRSLRLCPVQGDGYLNLVETGFLRDPDDKQHDALITQALLLRQYDPRTQYTTGLQALSSGQLVVALKRWNSVFHCNQYYREAITTVLARFVTASYVIAEFQPNVSELRDVLAVYRSAGRTDDILPILLEAERLVKTEADTASSETRIALLLASYEAAWDLQDRSRSEQLLRMAIAIDDQSYWPRHALGLLLYEQQQFSEASEQFLWCYEQHPDDVKLEKLVRESRRLSLYEGNSVHPVSMETARP